MNADNEKLYEIVQPGEVEDHENYEYFDQEFELGAYEDGDNGGEVALCVLSAINVGEIKKLSDLEGVCENAVRALDYVITHQDYPVKAAEKMHKRISIGIGITNLAYYLAKNKVFYE
jgi:ribonucleotide reductase alpha subunit